jgi:hypothetical protein
VKSLEVLKEAAPQVARVAVMLNPEHRTAWLRMQSEAKQSRGGSRCNLRFTGRFSEIAGKADPLSVKFRNGFKML